jgi:hypothetical protein
VKKPEQTMIPVLGRKVWVNVLHSSPSQVRPAQASTESAEWTHALDVLYASQNSGVALDDAETTQNI